MPRRIGPTSTTPAVSLIESYSLNSGNTAPRGAASTIAGDKTWVVDANRKVYVYNTSGGLLGSWTAGTLATNATVEGIATNGTDVWIVDAKSDKVYKYTGAATRLSGSQNAASSFSLNSANTSPERHRDRRNQSVGRERFHHGQGVQVHHRRLAGRQLDDHHRRRDQPDRDHDRSGQRQQHLDRRQRHRPRVPVQRCRAA